MTRTVHHLKIAHHTVKVQEVTIPGKMYAQKRDYVGYSYMISGGLMNWGTLHSERWTDRECLDAAIEKVREDHPRSREIWIKGEERTRMAA